MKTEPPIQVISYVTCFQVHGQSRATPSLIGRRMHKIYFTYKATSAQLPDFQLSPESSLGRVSF